MRLFAVGRRYQGMADEIVDLGGGLRRHISHEARAVAARHQQNLDADLRETLARNRRDLGADGELEVLEQGRV